MTTTSRVTLQRSAFALRALPNTSQRLPATWLGSTGVNTQASALGLSFDPSGNTLITNSTEAVADSLVIGMGESAVFSGTVADPSAQSTNLAVLAGGGSVDASAVASSEAAGNGDTLAQARAIHVGVANVSWTDRIGSPLDLGSTAAPLLASSSASAANLGFDASLSSFPDASLSSTSIVIGFDGSGAGTASPTNALFVGQPNAVVAAETMLDINRLNPNVAATATGSALAIGIRNYTIAPVIPQPSIAASAVPSSSVRSSNVRSAALQPAASTPSTRISGQAQARLTVAGRPSTPAASATTTGNLLASAVGIEAATIRTPGTGDTEISAAALAAAGIQSSTDASGFVLNGLTATGIKGGSITGSNSNHLITATAGLYLDPSLATTDVSGSFDRAGISDTRIVLANGNDEITGVISSTDEIAAQLGLSAAEVAAANAALEGLLVDGSNASFAGLRRVYASLGAGNDSVNGSSLDSSFTATMGSNRFSFDRALNTVVLGGQDDDAVTVTEQSIANTFITGAGDDEINLATSSGSGNTLIPGRGQDRVVNGLGTNTINQASYLAATEAASSPVLARQLASDASGSFWSSLDASQKALLWDHGLVTDGGGAVTGKVDVITGFKPGTTGSQADQLVLSSSLTKVTDSTWANPATTAIHYWNGTSWVLKEGSGPLGILVGPSAQILAKGFGSPFVAYATDTRQLLYDPDSNWSNGGAASMGTLSLAAGTDASTLTKANFAFQSLL